MGTWNRSFPDAESSMLVLTGIRQEIIKRVKLTNSCKLPLMESKEALVDPGVENFLAGLRAKLNDGNDEMGTYPDDLESGFVDDDMSGSGEIDDAEHSGAEHIDGAEHIEDAEHIDDAERSAGNPSGRQLVLKMTSERIQRWRGRIRRTMSLCGGEAVGEEDGDAGLDRQTRRCI